MTITIKYLEGPLAGKEQTFVEAIVFGRDREVAQVIYPPEYDDYTVELFGKRYVKVDGAPVDNGTPLNSGSTFRLGRKDGPSFKVDVGVPSAVGVPVTGDQSEMTSSSQRLGKRVAYGCVAPDEIEAERAKAAEPAANEFSPATLKTLQGAVYLVVLRDGNADKAEATARAFAGRG